jgi:type 1 fimbria pilin
MKTAGRATLALVAVLALCLGAFSAEALAGKKKKTVVVYFSGSPKFNNGGKVTAKGTLNTASACEPNRGVRLQLLDSTGVAPTPLDGSTSDSTGNWSLSGQLPNTLVPTATYSVRVKAKKRTVGKFVCQAGVSTLAPVPASSL